MWRYDDIAIVVAVAEQGSFIAAANMLAVPSSTLSRRVSELESQLGLRLFERNTRSLKLTAKGAELVASCSESIKSLQKAVQNVTSDADAMSGVLRVSAPITLAYDLMQLCFNRFIQSYPQIKLELEVSNEYSALFDEDIDVALRVGPLKDSELVAQKLFSTDMVLCASPTFIEQNSIDQGDINSLTNLALLNYSNSSQQLTATESGTGIQQMVELQAAFSSNHTQVLKTACVQGLGLACLPQISVQQELDRQELIRLFANYRFADSKTIYAVYPSKQYLPKKLKAFIEHIYATMNTTQ